MTDFFFLVVSEFLSSGRAWSFLLDLDIVYAVFFFPSISKKKQWKFQEWVSEWVCSFLSSYVPLFFGNFLFCFLLIFGRCSMIVQYMSVLCNGWIGMINISTTCSPHQCWERLRSPLSHVEICSLALVTVTVFHKAAAVIPAWRELCVLTDFVLFLDPAFPCQSVWFLQELFLR